MQGEPAIRRRLRELIKESLSLQYTASGKEGIVTGNPYQTVDLLGETIGGFRQDRSAIFDCFDFKNKTVLDIGSNLGELSRIAHRAGAKRVVGIEYDAYFMLISNLISIHNSLDPDEVRYLHADVTNTYEFQDEFDIVLAFSVFTYMGHRIKEIARQNKELMILETHNIDANWRDHYVRAHGKSRYQQKDSTLWGLASTWEMRLTGPIPRPERTLTTVVALTDTIASLQQ